MSDRQKQIIEVAIKLIAAHGIQNLTIKNLANEIGISEPALYRHFRNKSDILDAVIKHFSETMQSAFLKLKQTDNSLERIENFILEHFKIFHRNNDFARVIFSESNFMNSDLLTKKIWNMMKNSAKIIENVLDEGRKSGEIRSDLEISNLVAMIIGSIRLLVTQWSISGMSFDLQSRGKSLCKDILKVISN